MRTLPLRGSHKLAASNATTFLAQKGRLSSVARLKESKSRRQIRKSLFPQAHPYPSNCLGRLNKRKNCVKCTSITWCAATVHGKRWVEGAAVDEYHPEKQPSSNITVVTGTVVSNALQTILKKICSTKTVLSKLFTKWLYAAQETSKKKKRRKKWTTKPLKKIHTRSDLTSPKNLISPRAPEIWGAVLAKQNEITCSVSRQRWKTARTWQVTEVSGCGADRWSLKACPNGKCFATKHHQTLFGDQTCWCWSEWPNG